jgi:predicted small secreted protein
MNAPTRHSAALTLLILASLFFAGCTTTSGAGYEIEPTLTDAEHAAPAEAAASIEEPAADGGSKQEEGEVPLAVAESEHPAQAPREVVIQGSRTRDAAIHDLVAEAQTLLRDVELQYVFTGQGKNQVLRGRPVAFALWSEAKQEWSIAHIELPRPPIKWKPGGKPLTFRTLTPGIQARHVKGTGAERLMFAFSREGDPLKVYGRKFPVFDNNLIKHKQWSAVVQTAKPIVYLPFTEDTFDPAFVSSGKEFLIATARKAIEELRLAQVPSAAFRGELLADAISPQLIATLAVIEQTDDKDYVEKQALAFDEVLSQYGLKREEAYRYSVSSAKALGPMQFTNRKGRGTYALVVGRCPGARLDPSFESGATNLLNAMKAAACLLDLDLAGMREDIRLEYRANPEVLGIFPVAAYNGGSRNVAKLYRVLTRMKVKLDELNRPGVQLAGASVTCPCIWKTEGTDARPLAIPRYNNENRWYIEKYQSIVGLFEASDRALDSARTN